MAQCVLDYAHEAQSYPDSPDFLVGSKLFAPNCGNKAFLRSMMNPTADGYRSSSCWHPRFDKTVRAIVRDCHFISYLVLMVLPLLFVLLIVIFTVVILWHQITALFIPP